jgi:DNA-binding transcriptional regulator GbsR (MarR family)
MQINYKLTEKLNDNCFQGMQPLELSYSKAFIGQFTNHYAYFKQIQYLDGLANYLSYAYTNQAEISSKISEALSFFSVPMLVDKLIKAYEAFEKLDVEKAETQLEFVGSSVSAVSQALKVAKFVQKIFTVVALSKYKKAITIVQNSFEITANLIAYYKILNSIAKSKETIGKISEKIEEDDKRTFFEALKQQEELNLNNQYSALARTTSIICLSGLEILSQLAIAVSGADTIMLAGTTILTVSGLHDGFSNGVSKQIEKALDKQVESKLPKPSTVASPTLEPSSL